MTQDNNQGRPQGRRLAKFRTCKVRGHSTTFYVLRLYRHRAQVIPVDALGGKGILVDRADLREIHDPNQRPGLFPDADEQSEDQREVAPAEPEPPHPPAPLPYGLLDLDNRIVTDPGPPFRVKCYIQGCEELLRPAARKFHGDRCPVHGIYCHYSSGSRTYVYHDPRRNLLTSGDLFMKKVRYSKLKVESHRMGHNNGEDAATYSVFRSLQEAGCLHLVAQWILGREVRQEPLLFLWGLSSYDNQFRPWDLLTEARKKFEIGKLPIARPLSEPDLAMTIPGEFVLMVEIKVLSPNPVVFRGQPRSSSQSLTFEELIKLYHDPDQQFFDFEKVRQAEWLPSQLFRYATLGDYMSRLDGPNTQFYMCNLVRRGCELETVLQLSSLVRPEKATQVQRLTWEDVYALTGLHRDKLARLQSYMLNKAVGTSGGFVPAFQLEPF